MRFSKQYRSFTAWKKAQPRTSIYEKRIIRLHKLENKLTLKQLVIARIRDLDLSLKAWKLLSPKEKRERNLALQVLRNIRRGGTLKEESQKVGLPVQTVKKHLGSAIIQRRGRWFARPSDRIQRRMVIFEKNKGKTSITVTNSKDASLIGEYFSAVRKALKPTGDVKSLKKFKNRVIIDADGKKHKLETNLERLYEIQDEIEDIEFFEIYEDQ